MEIARNIAAILAPRHGKSGRDGNYPSPQLLPKRFDGRKLSIDWSTSKAVSEGYRKAVYVYIAVAAVMEAVSSIPWYVEVKRGDSWERDDDHPLFQLWELQPNPKMDRARIVETLVAHLELGGNGLLHKLLLSRKLEGSNLPAVTEIWPLQLEGFSPIASQQDFLSGYRFELGGVKKDFPAAEVVHFQFTDPGNPYWGMAPLRAAAMEVDILVESSEWNRASFENRAVASGAFVTDEPLSRKQWNESRQRVFEQHQGSLNAHVPWVLGGGWKWHQMSLSPVEMDWIASRAAVRDDILSVYGVPPVVAGFFNDATLANAETSRRLFWSDTVVPILSRLESTLNRHLVPHFGDPMALQLTYDLTGVEALRLDRDSEAAVLMKLQEAGVPYNEALRATKFDFSDQGELGDQPFGILGLAPSRSIQLATSNGSSNGDKSLPRATERITARLEGQKALPLRAEADQVGDIDSVARGGASRLRGIVLAAAKEASSGIDSKRLRRALESMSDDAIAAALRLDLLAEQLAKIVPVQLSVLQEAASIAAIHLEMQVGAALSYDPKLLAAPYRPKAAEMVEGLVGSTRRGIEKLGAALRSGALAGLLLDELEELAALLVGLNGNQAGTVLAFAEKLIESGVPPARAIKQAERLGLAHLADRALNIGENEALNAARQGQRALWGDAIGGQFIGEATKTWVDADDRDVCEICLSLDGQTVDAPDGVYTSPFNGQSYFGPGEPHNRCRCGEIYLAAKVA